MSWGRERSAEERADGAGEGRRAVDPGKVRAAGPPISKGLSGPPTLSALSYVKRGEPSRSSPATLSAGRGFRIAHVMTVSANPDLPSWPIAKTREAGSSGLALFAAELVAARRRANLSQDELASRITYSGSMVAMIEGLRRVPSLDFAKRCDQVFETTGTFVLRAGSASPSAEHQRR